MVIRRLGADPEFEIVRDGHLVRADKVVRTTRLPFGEIGVDGAGVALELRPNPGDVDELVRNTAKLIVATPSVCRGTPTTIGVGHPLGGHVHFDAPGDTDYATLVRVVDDALGPLFRAMNGPARDKSGYGKRRDWRSQPWGVEYRTPPATIWAHPEVAKGFLSAMLTLALSDGREMSPGYEELVELATFAIEHGRRLHYGAWKRVADEVRPELGIIYTHDTERDEHFEGDMEAALAPLGIPLLRVLPLHKRRGDWASNLPGFGSRDEGISPAHCEAGELYVALSWRFRNDRAFRIMAMPAFLEAVLGLIRDANEPELDEKVVVVEPVEKPAASEDAKEKVKKAAEEERSAPAPTPPIATEEEEDDEYVRCHRCGERVHIDDAFYNRYDDPFCPECYRDTYTLCDRCECEVHRDDAYYPSTGRYEGASLCEECYAEVYTECARCGYEIEVDDAIVPTSGGYSGSYMCEHCYEYWYTRCECGGEVERDRAHEENGRTLCERCVEEVEA
jgi:hypothetical protein